MSKLVPFGKYRGQPVEVMMADREYCEWLAAQPWFRQRFGDVYNIVINYGSEPSDTPEHNALQAKFLDEGFCLSLARSTRPLWFDTKAAYEAETYALAERELATERSESPVAVRRISFEHKGWDVCVNFTGGLYISSYNRLWIYGPEGLLLVEVKPVIGDDYPSVLRQVKRYPYDPGSARVVLAESFMSDAVSLSQAKRIFAADGIDLLLLSEVALP